MLGVMRKLAEAGRLKKARNGKWTVCLGHIVSRSHTGGLALLEHKGVTSLHYI